MPDPDLQPARELLATGRFAEAARLLEPIHKSHPDNVEAAHALALSFGQMGMRDRALALFEKLITPATTDPALLLNYGVALFQAGRAPESVAALRRAVAADPKLAGAHYNLALALKASGDLPTAAVHFQTAARLFPDGAIFWRDAARAAGDLGKWDEAVESYRKCVAAEPCHLDAQHELGLALAKSGREDEAVAEFRRLLAEAPLLAASRNQLVSLLAKREEFEEAEKLLKEGLEASPDNADFQHNLGTVHSLKGDLPAALGALRQALLIEPTRRETSAAIAALRGAVPVKKQARIAHQDPFQGEAHHIGTLTFRVHELDDLARAAAHVVPAILAEYGRSKGEIRHVAPFPENSTDRADILFDYLDPGAEWLAGLTRSLKVEKWILGEIAPAGNRMTVKLWTPGVPAPRTQDLSLDPAKLGDAVRAAATFAELDLPKELPSDASLIRYGLGATASDPSLAFEHLLKSVEEKLNRPAETEFLRRLVAMLEAGEDRKVVLGWLERLAAKGPTGRQLALRGQILFGLSDYDGARATWTEAARLDPAFTPSPIPAAWLEIKAGKLDVAEKLFKLAVDDPDEGPSALVGLGSLAVIRQDLKAARERFLEALARHPKLPEALFQMAMTYVAEKKPDEATRWAEKLEQAHPGHDLVLTLAKLLGRA